MQSSKIPTVKALCFVRRLVCCQWVRVSCLAVAPVFFSSLGNCYPCVVIVSLNKWSCSNKSWPTISSTQELSSELSTQYPTWFMTTLLWDFLKPETLGRRKRERKKSLECFVSCNYSPIIWSKYGITGHFVVQTAWLWSSCGRMCFALEACYDICFLSQQG